MPTTTTQVTVRATHELPRLSTSGPRLKLNSPMMVDAITAHFNALPNCAAKHLPDDDGTFSTDYQVNLATRTEESMPLSGEFVELVCRVFTVRILWMDGAGAVKAIRLDLSAEMVSL